MQKYGRCTVKSSTLRGVEGLPVEVEVVVSRGFPGFFIVGMPDVAIQEAKERIKSALQACGFVMPAERIVVNLAPGSIRKGGTGFDLPIAVGILVATAQVAPAATEGYLLVGELSLDGDVRAVPGLLSHALCARREGLTLLCGADGASAVPLDHVGAVTVASLADCASEQFLPVGAFEPRDMPPVRDFKDIAGHEVAKRALQIAAAGGHGVLMMGPPGSGKTMLASCLPSILPPLNAQEQMETAQIYSVAGESTDGIMAGVRPFRMPHHSSTLAGLIGGGAPLRPGEASLAHNGVLFLDELAEFKPSALQALRQPMESGEINLTRADGNVRFPARFALVAACNPCPCGYYGDEEERCTCTLPRVESYQNRIGGPLMDRIAVRIHVARLSPERVLAPSRGASSASLLEGVLKAREFAQWRERRANETAVVVPDASDSSLARLLHRCAIDEAVLRRFGALAKEINLSGRGIVKALSVARTIADLAQRQTVLWEHCSEALQYRARE